MIHRFRTLLILHALRISSFFTPDEQRIIQELRLRQLFQHIYTRSRFWRDYLIKSGIQNPQLIKLDEIHHLPYISKDELRAMDQRDLYVAEKGDVIYRITTGTTGDPFRTEWSAQDFQLWAPYCLRAIPEDIFLVNLKTLRQRFFVLMGGFNPQDWPLGHLAQKWDVSIDSSRRYIVYENASGLERFSEENNLSSLPFALIYAAAEHLSDQSRDRLERYFKAPVRRFYGMRDCGWMAWECGHENNALHINTERFILETIDSESGKSVFDAPGEIVVTLLDSWRMPRIRFRTGDIGILQSSLCKCGMTLPLIRFVGRTSEFLILPSGKKISALQIQSAIWRIIMRSKQVQIRQYSPAKICVFLVPKHHAADLTVELGKKLGEILKEKISIEVSIVSEVPEQKGGKRPFFVPIRNN